MEGDAGMWNGDKNGSFLVFFFHLEIPAGQSSPRRFCSIPRGKKTGTSSLAPWHCSSTIPTSLRASLAHRIGAGKTQDGGNRRIGKRLVPLVSMSSNQIFGFLRSQWEQILSSIDSSVVPLEIFPWTKGLMTSAISRECIPAFHPRSKGALNVRS